WRLFKGKGRETATRSLNILDENIDSVARERLRWLKVSFRHIGSDIGHSGMKDLNDVIPLLHSLKHPTFFTRDEDFYTRILVHREYCLVHLDVPPGESAEYISRFLRHRNFRTKVDRIGKVVRVRRSGVSYFEQHNSRRRHVRW
ncbi:MAG TPA: hypothetical protein VN937_18490, partial [Blastocatellia bacterium]|nr:hypothetical protein [Blastocatellia bacterium]